MIGSQERHESTDLEPPHGRSQQEVQKPRCHRRSHSGVPVRRPVVRRHLRLIDERKNTDRSMTGRGFSSETPRVAGSSGACRQRLTLYSRSSYRTGDRAAEGTGLLNRRTGYTGTTGSNPVLSASRPRFLKRDGVFSWPDCMTDVGRGGKNAPLVTRTSAPADAEALEESACIGVFDWNSVGTQPPAIEQG